MNRNRARRCLKGVRIGSERMQALRVRVRRTDKFDWTAEAARLADRLRDLGEKP